jgi:Uma2 family endonuclease
MAGAPLRDRPRVSIELFRAFVADRPEEERWELIDGVAVMMAPPTLAHQVIAGNVQRLLFDALVKHAPTLIACQRVGVNLGPSVAYYDPEPDVAVIDSAAAERPDERYAARFYLAAEVVSSSDRIKSESKREVYKLHDACKCILTIQQDRFEVRIDTRTGAGWREETLKKPDDLVELPDFGLRCDVSDFYRGTALAPRRVG